jgi:Protein of unknown function (DUF3108)
MIRLSFLALLCGVVPGAGLMLTQAAPTASAPVAAPTPAPVPAAAPVPSGLPSIDLNHVPWANGESLTYIVSLGTLQAAEGTFVARNKGARWEFDLALKSRGVIDTVYPFTGNFWCLLAGGPWRSVEYGEYRFEPKRTIKERTQIDYTKLQGTREIWSEGKTTTFPIAEDGVDDVGTMLYHLRALPWKPGDKHTFFVYESDSEKEGNAECEARETRVFGKWPAQPVLRISVLPGKGTHHRGHLTVWITDDGRRFPLHAELDFRYGSFDLDLDQVGIAPPTPPTP